MSLIVDTNILLRAMIFDHEVESPKAQALLASNEGPFRIRPCVKWYGFFVGSTKEARATSSRQSRPG
ncbi:Hypothetical protein NGAL_HAMBI1146_32850 [Neorhizobium galegae bv. officinalis]|nr:Hypothetical protein NGAL_HAMBI1146_32850 [Neorhizobium galegae bv. officinalis]